MQQFVFYKKENFLAFTKIRPGETKLGEKILAIQHESRWSDEVKRSTARFVLIGIPEDIGVKANLGMGGTQTAWNAFLASFFNIQQNGFLDAEKILLLGYFDFSDLQKNTKGKPVELVREAVAKIDKQVADVIRKIVAAGKIPIVIGGGHNNAYGNIKGAAIGLAEIGRSRSVSVNCINLDAHTDFRILEGRHSGNGFSYAFAEGYLKKYAVIGVHENYITNSILEEMDRNKNLQVSTYEGIFVKEKITFQKALQQAIAFTKDGYIGLELDLDSIENVLSSAASPSGISVLQARQFIHQTASASKVAYLHICEGAAKLDDGQSSSTVGKLIACLVSDFVKAIE